MFNCLSREVHYCTRGVCTNILHKVQADGYIGCIRRGKAPQEDGASPVFTG